MTLQRFYTQKIAVFYCFFGTLNRIVHFYSGFLPNTPLLPFTFDIQIIPFTAFYSVLCGLCHTNTLQFL